MDLDDSLTLDDEMNLPPMVGDINDAELEAAMKTPPGSILGDTDALDIDMLAGSDDDSKYLLSLSTLSLYTLSQAPASID